MIFIGILFCIAGIVFLCWVLFSLAVYALPLFAGVAAGMWAYDTGAGLIGAFAIGIVAAGATLAVGQFAFTLVRPLWARLAIAVVFAMPAALAGYHATHGLVKLTMPSAGWQIAFSMLGAVAVGITAWTRLLPVAPHQPATEGIPRGQPSMGRRVV